MPQVNEISWTLNSLTLILALTLFYSSLNYYTIFHKNVYSFHMLNFLPVLF